MSSKINPITSILTYFSPPTQRFSSRCWVGGVFKVHSFVRNGLQGRPGKVSEARARGQSVSRSPYRTSRSSSATAVFTWHSCSPRIIPAASVILIERGEGREVSEEILFFPLQKHSVVSLPLVTEEEGKHWNPITFTLFSLDVLLSSWAPGLSACVLPSEWCVLMDRLQAAQQLEIRAAGRGHRLKDGLESPAVQLLVYLVSVEIHGDQTEQVDVHHLAGAHAADHVRQSGGGQQC